eukprot:10014674-Alexandrium_andersonii.AAC.1
MSSLVPRGATGKRSTGLSSSSKGLRSSPRGSSLTTKSFLSVLRRRTRSAPTCVASWASSAP